MKTEYRPIVIEERGIISKESEFIGGYGDSIGDGGSSFIGDGGSAGIKQPGDEIIEGVGDV